MRKTYICYIPLFITQNLLCSNLLHILSAFRSLKIHEYTGYTSIIDLNFNVSNKKNPFYRYCISLFFKKNKTSFSFLPSCKYLAFIEQTQKKELVDVPSDQFTMIAQNWFNISSFQYRKLPFFNRAAPYDTDEYLYGFCLLSVGSD